MLDSGSEVNIIKENSIPDESKNKINRSNACLLSGIGAHAIESVGTIQLELLGKIHHFIVAPPTLFIPFQGILGTPFFTIMKAALNFQDSLLETSAGKMSFKQNKNPVFYAQTPRLTNVSSELAQNALPFVQFGLDLTSPQKRFLVDSGSEANIIKKHIIPENREIDTNNRSELLGIGREPLQTLGTITISLFGIKDEFQVVPSNFPLPGEGILGAAYLTKAAAFVDYPSQSLTVNEKTFPLILQREFPPSTNSVTVQADVHAVPDEININSRASPSPALYGSDCGEEDRLDEINSISELNPSEEIENLNLNNESNITNEINSVNLAETEIDSINSTTVNSVKEAAYRQIYATMSHELNEELDIEKDGVDETMETAFLQSEYNDRLDSISDPPRTYTEVLNALHLNHLNDEQLEHVKTLIKKHQDCFLTDGRKLGAASSVMHRIITTDDVPINIRQYKFPLSLKDEVERQVQKLLDDGVIKPSSSPYNSPLWIVPKKPDANGNPRWRLVSDFRALNEKTVSDAYPLPDITQIIDQIGGHKYYTTLDLAQGFLQILMDPRDSHKTAFSTPHGHYEYVRMTFGLKNSPPTFQRYIDETFKGIQGKAVFTFIDDLIIAADTLDEHAEKLEQVFDRLRQSNLQINVDKCEFLKSEVRYLGHTLSEAGIKPDPRKLDAVDRFPQPTNIKQIRQFLGLAGYYRRFIDHFAKISKPLTKLLQKDTEFSWNDACEQAFQTLKTALCNPPVLRYPNFSLKFNITTDASGYAIGGVLSQGEIGQDQPIAYASRVLRGPELKYEVYEKEALAMLFCVQTFRTYIYGRPFNLITDHQPLVWFKSADLNTRVQKWRFKLSEYDYTVIYKPGKLNSNADALSRNPPVDVTCHALTRAQLRAINNPVLNNTVLPAQPTIKRPVGRPRKNPITINETREITNKARKDKPMSAANESDEQSCSVESDTIDSLISSNQSTAKQLKIAETKEGLHFRKDHIVYFTDTNGTPFDEGGQLLLSANKIPRKIENSANLLHVYKNTHNQYLIGLRIPTASSQTDLENSINNALIELREFITINKIDTLSIAYSVKIGALSWAEILSKIKATLHKNPIKILICKNTLQYVPLDQRDAIFHELHNSPIGGHRGVSKTFYRIRQNFYWENLKADIQRRIQQCLECQLKKLRRIKTKQPMCISDTPGTTFDKVALDIVGPLPRTREGHEFILTMQDQLSKFCLAVPLQNALATTTADALIKKLICIFGAPRVIITDQGRNFMSKLMEQVARRFRIKRLRTTAFHPQANGSLERSHHALAEYLKQYASTDEEWDTWLDLAVLNYNTCVQESTKFSPFEVVFGRPARLPSNNELSHAEMQPTYADYLRNLLEKLTEIRKIAYENLEQSKLKSKRLYDQKCNPVEFRVGDYVFLKKGPKPHKLEAQYTGPHKILEILGPVNIKIAVGKKTQIVHANRLKISNIRQAELCKKTTITPSELSSHN